MNDEVFRNAKGWLVFKGDVEPGWKYELSARGGEHRIDVQLARVIQYDDSIGTGARERIDYPGGLSTVDPFSVTASGPLDSIQANYKGPVLGGVLNLNGRLSADSFEANASLGGSFHSLPFLIPEVHTALAVAGLPEIMIGDTLADPDHAHALPRIHVDEPAISVTIGTNTSPLAG